MPAFTLAPQTWAAWQMIPGYFGERCVPYCSPIWVRRVTPKKTGRGILHLEFWNVGYAEGVQGFSLDLQVLYRAADYFVAKLLYEPNEDSGRCAIVSRMEFDWLRAFCPSLCNGYPPARYGPDAEGDVSLYLDAVFRPDKEA